MARAAGPVVGGVGRSPDADQTRTNDIRPCGTPIAEVRQQVGCVLNDYQPMRWRRKQPHSRRHRDQPIDRAASRITFVTAAG